MFLNKKLTKVQETTGYNENTMAKVKELYRKIKKFTRHNKEPNKAVNVFLGEVQKATTKNINNVLYFWEKAYQEAKELRENFGAL